jgi:adenylate cyclase
MSHPRAAPGSRGSRRRHLSHGITLLLVLLAALTVRWVDTAGLRDLRLMAFDSLQRLDPRPYQPLPITILDIDERALDQFGQWPWSRALLARIMDRLGEAGAAVVALDVVFAEADRTAPAQTLALWRELGAVGPDAAEMIAALPDPDALFAEALATVPAVTGFVLESGDSPAPPPKPVGWALAGDDPRPFLPSYGAAIEGLPALYQVARGHGALNLIPDQDGVVRRVPLVLRAGEHLRPSLVGESLRVAQGASGYVVRASGASGATAFGQRSGVIAVRVGEVTVPTDAAGQAWLWDSGHQPDRFVSVAALMDEAFPLERLRHHIVLFGTTAAGLKDQRASPLEGVIAGVELHAQILEQALLGQALTRPDWAPGAEVLMTLLAGLALGLGLLLLPSGVLVPLGLALVVAPPALAWTGFTQARWLLDPVFPAATLALLFGTGLALRYLTSDAERRDVRAAFSRYLAPALVERLASAPEQLRLGGEVRPLTLMFCDIRDFTTLSEGLRPDQLTDLINQFLTPMTGAVLDHGGTVDKYIGDCLMAFWNAPLDDPNHARHACDAALAMLAALEAVNAERALSAHALGQPAPEPLRIGIGINTGPACVGNMGSDQRFNYSALGDAVNLASRLEAQTKTFGTPIIISEDTLRAATESPSGGIGNEAFACLDLGRVFVKGRRDPVRAHALLGDAALARSASFLALSEAHAAFMAARSHRNATAIAEAVATCRDLVQRLDSAQARAAALPLYGAG